MFPAGPLLWHGPPSRHPDRERQGDRMKIGFLGAGKVGFSLGKWFVQGGIPVTGYHSRHRESAQEAAAWTGTRCFPTAEALVTASDAIFFTVPDGAIPTVYQGLGDLDLTGKQLCHCSGARTAREGFPGPGHPGASYYSIHPLFPVSGKYSAWRELSGAFFCLEGEGPHLPWWEETLTALGAQVRRIPSGEKAAYHAACAMASNLVCALVGESVTLLARCGFSQEEALAALAPLMEANLRHLCAEGPVAALTGPVERGDGTTIARHLACLPAGPARALYRAASVALVDLARKKHPDRDYQPVTDLLEKGSNP